MKARRTAMAVLVGYAVVPSGFTLIAPSKASARKIAIKRLVEEGYATSTAKDLLAAQIDRGRGGYLSP